MDEPLSALGEATAATHELYSSYIHAGFTPDHALYLTGIHVFVVGQRVTGQAPRDPVRRLVDANVCRTHGLPLVAQASDEPGMYRWVCVACEVRPADDRPTWPSCAICGTTLDGEMVCPQHPPGPRFMGGQPT